LIEKYQGVKQMNLSKLFDLQRQLDEHIEREHPRQEGEDRLAKKILALMVELGELANEWRGFKFWSNDQEPRTEVKIPCRFCSGAGKGYFCGNEYTGQKEQCIYCHGTGVEKIQNRLLEEYVDCLHFILSIGLEIKYGTEYNPNPEINVFVSKATYKEKNVINQFNLVFELASAMSNDDYYFELFASFIHLGEMLGFSWQEIEEAYLRKNVVNHQRQESGY
jgi:dimeric dUTPase (all-alpha-NTP-PPase superfamily)